MRQVYVAGERTFVDYAGQTVPIFESPHIRLAGEQRPDIVPREERPARARHALRSRREVPFPERQGL